MPWTTPHHDQSPAGWLIDVRSPLASTTILCSKIVSVAIAYAPIIHTADRARKAITDLRHQMDGSVASGKSRIASASKMTAGAHDGCSCTASGPSGNWPGWTR